MLEEAYYSQIVVTRRWVVPRGTCAENILLHVGVLGRSGGLGTEQLKVEGDRDPARDLVLQGDRVNRSPVSPSNRSAHRCASVRID
jgi:hypothetical protein